MCPHIENRHNKGMAFTITAPKQSVTLTVFESNGTSPTLDLTPFADAMLEAPATDYNPLASGLDIGQIEITGDVAFFEDGAPIDVAKGLALLGSGLIHALRLFLNAPGTPEIS
jgi:hypothetical protein